MYKMPHNVYTDPNLFQTTTRQLMKRRNRVFVFNYFAPTLKRKSTTFCQKRGRKAISYTHIHSYLYNIINKSIIKIITITR